jgi:hypothetical protein
MFVTASVVGPASEGDGAAVNPFATAAWTDKGDGALGGV